MLPEEIPPDEGPVTDPAALEEVMRRAADSPALHGPLMRMLLEARVWVFVPSHPELEGEYLMDVREGFTWCNFKDERGAFTPVFVTLAIAEKRHAMLPEPKPAIVELPAKIFFGFVNGTECIVRVFASNGASVTLPPVAVANLLAGAFTEVNAGDGQWEQIGLQPIPEAQLPAPLRDAVLEFCEQRQGAIAVYAFHPINKESGRASENDIRFVLRLRDQSGHFYNDFSLMISRTTPAPFQSAIGTMRTDDDEALAFLARCTPLWPRV